MTFKIITKDYGYREETRYFLNDEDVTEQISNVSINKLYREKKPTVSFLANFDIVSKTEKVENIPIKKAGFRKRSIINGQS